MNFIRALFAFHIPRFELVHDDTGVLYSVPSADFSRDL